MYAFSDQVLQTFGQKFPNFSHFLTLYTCCRLDRQIFFSSGSLLVPLFVQRIFFIQIVDIKVAC